MTNITRTLYIQHNDLNMPLDLSHMPLDVHAWTRDCRQETSVYHTKEIIFCMRTEKERRRCIVSSSFIGWALPQNDPPCTTPGDMPKWAFVLSYFGASKQNSRSCVRSLITSFAQPMRCCHLFLLGSYAADSFPVHYVGEFTTSRERTFRNSPNVAKLHPEPLKTEYAGTSRAFLTNRD